MKQFTEKINGMLVPLLSNGWAKYSEAVLLLAILVMAASGLSRLSQDFRRLTVAQGPSAAIDLKFYHEAVHRWVAGNEVQVSMRSEYPPASNLILWPLVGWLDLPSTRLMWALTSIAALAWLTFLIVKESGARTLYQRVFVALLLFSASAMHLALGNGQLIVQLLPILLSALLLLHRSPTEWRRDLLASILLLLTLVKPSISVPFLCLALFIYGQVRFRPILLVTLGYVMLTLFAASFQRMELSTLVLTEVENSLGIASQGYGSLHSFLAAMGLKQWLLPASTLAFIALGVWTSHNRRQDIWLLLGVAALVARFWTYHRHYDDLLILIPEIALFRIAKQGSFADAHSVAAGVLLAFNVLLMLIPARAPYIPIPLIAALSVVATSLMIIDLVFLYYVHLTQKLQRPSPVTLQQPGRIGDSLRDSIFSVRSPNPLLALNASLRAPHRRHTCTTRKCMCRGICDVLTAAICLVGLARDG